MYAISARGYRAVLPDSQAMPGETIVHALPLELVERMRVLEARSDRDQLLRGCDWTVADDSPLGPAKKLEWITYRQLLRDLPGKPGFPTVQWPQAPSVPDGTADAGSGGML